ncbi:hypothetical protein HAX54_013633, partial [Datura stramonium]|nr:hypothetical protein [Datura stramonium]
TLELLRGAIKCLKGLSNAFEAKLESSMYSFYDKDDTPTYPGPGLSETYLQSLMELKGLFRGI